MSPSWCQVISLNFLFPILCMARLKIKKIVFFSNSLNCCIYVPLSSNFRIHWFVKSNEILATICYYTCGFTCDASWIFYHFCRIRNMKNQKNYYCFQVGSKWCPKRKCNNLNPVCILPNDFHKRAFRKSRWIDPKIFLILFKSWCRTWYLCYAWLNAVYKLPITFDSWNLDFLFLQHIFFL